MTVISHLRSLQALDMALRCGSLKEAGKRLGITPAAVGQRIRALEEYLGTELLLRGRSGLRPTREAEAALDDLHLAFDALDRVSEQLDFQRTIEIHIVADPDWAELWLLPRLASFRRDHPNILFCINGEGDVPVRLGAADIYIDAPRAGDAVGGEPLYRDVLLPFGTEDVVDRLQGTDPETCLEGFPLLHLADRDGHPSDLGWPDWFARWGHRRTAIDRGVRYDNARLALDGVRSNVGLFLGRLSFVAGEVADGRFHLPFPHEALRAPAPYVLRLRPGAERRPQVQRLRDWLRAEASRTEAAVAALLARPPRVAFG